MPQAKVLKIDLAFTQKGNYHLNKINFEDGVYAFEKIFEGRSKFTEGECATYAVTHPGHDGKPDWIEWLADCKEGEKVKEVVNLDLIKAYTIIMQNALTNATNLYIASNANRIDLIQKTYAIDAEEVLKTAKILAAGVIDTAIELAKNR